MALVNKRVTLKDLLERKKKWQIAHKQEEFVLPVEDKQEIETISQDKEVATKARTKRKKKTTTATVEDTEKASVPEQRAYMVADEDELKKEISE